LNSGENIYVKLLFSEEEKRELKLGALLALSCTKNLREFFSNDDF
jgi:hypothetical protein